jgi:hypothetical protein
MTTPGFSGNYWVDYCAEVNNDAASDTGDVEVKLSNTTDVEDLCIAYIETQDRINYYSVGGFASVTFSGTSKVFKIMFRRADASGMAKIRNARIRIRRKD